MNLLTLLRVLFYFYLFSLVENLITNKINNKSHRYNLTFESAEKKKKFLEINIENLNIDISVKKADLKNIITNCKNDQYQAYEIQLNVIK